MPRKRAVAVAVVLSALLTPVAFGLGLGTLKTKSALNEPFEARVEVVSASVQDFDALTVKLADEEQFSRAGVARDAVLLNLRFEVVSSEVGADYIRITTKDPVREPFLNFLLELNWAQGRLIREYTVLLDPPLYDRNRQPATTSVAPAPAASPPTSVPAPAPGAAPAAQVPAAASDGTLGPVTANDTAWSLAMQHRPDANVSVHQMMLALLRSNPDAFSRANVNLLLRGAVMRLPSSDEINSLSQSDAVAEIRRQHQLWEEYRQAATAEVAEEPLGGSSDVVAGVSESTDADVDARLELAAPEAEDTAQTPGGETADGGDTTANDTLIKEDLDAKAQENTELQAKVSEADQIIDLLQRQIQVKDEELAALQARLGDSATPETPATEMPKSEPPVAERPIAEAPEEVPAVSDVSKPATETPVITPEPKLPPALEEPAPSGILATVSNLIPEHVRNVVPGGPLTLLGIVASLLVLIVVGIGRALLGERDKATVSTPKAPISTITAAATTVLPDVTREDLAATREDLTAFDPTPHADQEQFLRTMEATNDQPTARPGEDPLEEVNVYLAYERFDQAEELVKKVINKYPGEHLYKLRLLEIYYSANNKRAYEEAARELLAVVGDTSPLWENAVAMWTEMSPGRPLFAPGADYGTPVDPAGPQTFVDITGDTSAAGEGTMSMSPGSDSMLASTQVGLTNTTDESSGLDFDIAEPADLKTDSEADIEFDLALQDTTDFENLAIDETLELPKSATARSGAGTGGLGESLEDLTRSMEQSFAGLDLEDDKSDDGFLDIGLDSPGTDSIDLDFGLDDGTALTGLDTLALDPEELRATANAISQSGLSMPSESIGDYDGSLDETDTKLNLAKAYIELGDNEGARSILNDVIANGSSAQQDEARKLLAPLS
ncbi:MAG: hypothetical protein EXR86_14515 [Gammaproteobacteria bacterium]|nr:hypothetical protein [Gammaproteobacteria bacterium]